MLFRVFTLPFDPFSERFDDTPVRDYLSDKIAVPNELAGDTQAKNLFSLFLHHHKR
jgi:hypothetical protein